MAIERSNTQSSNVDPFVKDGPIVVSPSGQAPAGATPAAHEKPKSQAELRADAARARAELAGTLDAIELKLNLPYQARLRGRRMRMGMRKLQDDRPLAAVGLLAGAVAVVAGTVWLGIKAIRER